MEVRDELYTPGALSPGKQPLIPMEKEAGWAPEPVWMSW